MSVPLRLLKTEPPLTSRLAIETRIVPSVSPIFSRLIRVSGRMRGPIRASFARAAARPASSARSSKSSCGASMVASIFVRPSRLRTVALARIAERPTEEPRLGDMIELLEACSPRTHGHCHRARVERCRHRAFCCQVEKIRGEDAPSNRTSAADSPASKASVMRVQRGSAANLSAMAARRRDPGAMANPRFDRDVSITRGAA